MPLVKVLPANVWILSIAQALVMSMGAIIILVGGIVGASLAPNEKLATLPVALMIVGTAFLVIPVASLMNWVGRKTAFSIILSISLINALVASFALQIQSFNLFCACAMMFGLTNACVMQFRFAAMESVEEELIPHAASAVLIGGIAAAFIGPEIAVAGRHMFSTEFFGSFSLIAVLFLLAMIILRFYKNVEYHESKTEVEPRTLTVIFQQRVFWVALSSAACGYLVMSFIMTATPVSMNVIDFHTLDSTKFVIQSHILAMFVPSIFTGFLLRRLGIHRMMTVGVTMMALCIIIAYSGHTFTQYLIALILLGVGWNFLFIAGTSLLPQSYQTSEKYKVQAVNDSVVFGCQAIASLFAGWLVFTIGWEMMLLTMLPVILVQSIIIYFWSAKKHKA